MNQNNNETLFVTYMYPKCCKWKTKTKKIRRDKLEEYERIYRVISVISMEDYYAKLDKEEK